MFRYEIADNLGMKKKTDWAEWLREALRNSGMTQQDASDKSGVPQATISRIISGTTASPTVENLELLSKATGYPIPLESGEINEPLLTTLLQAVMAEATKRGLKLKPDQIAGVAAFLYREAIKKGKVYEDGEVGLAMEVWLSITRKH